MKKFGTLLLLALGAVIALVWRNQQARNKATALFDAASSRLQDASAALPTGSQSASSGSAKQPQRSTPATTTMLSQTAPDAGVSMSGSTATDTAVNTASSAAADHSAGAVRGTAATLASDESSFAQPVVRALDEQDDSSQADDSTSSQADEHYATVENVIESSHQPDSMEVSESDEQMHSAADEAAAQRVSPQSDSEITTTASQPARANDTQSVTMGNDPDAGQLMADGEDRTITDRIRSRLGQELDHKEWGHLNINTQSIGDVYLRGYVASEELRSRIEQLVSETEGVQSVVNELNVEEQNEA